MLFRSPTPHLGHLSPILLSGTCSTRLPPTQADSLAPQATSDRSRVRRLVFRPRVAGTDARHLALARPLRTPVIPRPQRSSTTPRATSSSPRPRTTLSTFGTRTMESASAPTRATTGPSGRSTLTVSRDVRTRSSGGGELVARWIWTGALSGRVRCSTAARGSAKARARSVGMASRCRPYL